MDQPTTTGAMIATVMEEGIAHIYLCSKQTQKLRGKVEQSITKKKGYNTSKVQGQKEKFFEKILSYIEQTTYNEKGVADPDKIQCFVMGSPGFLKEAFQEFVREKLKKNNSNEFLKQVNKKLLLVHTSSGFKHSLQEILDNKMI